MKGLYLDVPKAREWIAEVDQALGHESVLASATHHNREIWVSYHAADWPQGPIFHDPERDLTLAASGWFYFRGGIGDLPGLAAALGSARSHEERRTVLAEIVAGAYVLVLLMGTETILITDPFGLHPHYVLADEPTARLAPTPRLVSEDGSTDPLLSAALEKQDHLFDNLTAYCGVERLEPGAVTTSEGCTQYFDYTPGESGDEKILVTLETALALFKGRPRILPLSGGLDSRLLLASGCFEYGYTYGPRDTGDRPIARRFAGHFDEYREFSLLDQEYPEAHWRAGMRMLEGVCARPFVELLPVFAGLRRCWPYEAWFFDGYAGDVLQRGLYLTAGGIYGSLAKLFPPLTMCRFQPLTVLRRRYARLSPQAFALLADAFEQKTSGWQMDAPRRTVLFEMLYGKGTRHTLNGGTIFSGQFFSPIQPFVIPSVFRAFWARHPFAGLTYKTIHELWQQVPREFADVPTYSGFKPTWHPHRARTTMLVVKGLGKKGIIRRSLSYENELRHIVWR